MNGGHVLIALIIATTAVVLALSTTSIVASINAVAAACGGR